MAQKNTKNISVKDAVINAALSLAATKKWNDIDFDEIIKTAHCDKHDVMEYFDDKGDILVAYGRKIDRQMIKNADLKPLADINITVEDQNLIRERLFDLIMERFDILNENRDAVLNVLDSIKFDPKQALHTFPHLGKSMGRILEEAGETLHGLKGCTKIAGLTVVYLYTVKTWKDDDTADMARTMAALDKALGLAEETANTLTGGDIFGFFNKMKSNFSKS